MAMGRDTLVALVRWAVIGEATDERLTPAERGQLVSDLARCVASPRTSAVHSTYFCSAVKNFLRRRRPPPLCSVMLGAFREGPLEPSGLVG